MNLNVDAANLLLFWQVLFVASAVVQFFYLLFIFGRVAFFKPSQSKSSLKPVSVVIAARNEHDNLRENLPLILDQEYPEYEVVVVNNGSYDESDALLHAIQKTEPRLHVVNIPENERFDGGKKLAVTLGIKAAKHDRVLLTDADCRPFGKNWIKSMVASARNEGDIVLGYSPYEKSPGLLNALIRYDGVYTAHQYLGFALAGSPYMGVGRNLSYPKKLFFNVGGFKSHYSIRSGDDDLLINQIARKENTSICLSSDGHMLTESESSLKNFWRQKRRHLTTGWHYRKLHRIQLVLQPLSFFLLLVASVALLLESAWIYVVGALWLLRILLQIAIFRRSSRLLGQKDLAFFAPLLEIATLAFAACVHIANASSKQTRWKN